MSQFTNNTGGSIRPVRRAPADNSSYSANQIKRPVQKSASPNTASDAKARHAQPASTAKSRPAAKAPAAKKPAANRPSTKPPVRAKRPVNRPVHGKGKGPDWPVILTLAGCVIVLIAIIALLVFGIVRCASGCNANDTPTTPQNLQIVPRETPVSTVGSEVGSDGQTPDDVTVSSPVTSDPAGSVSQPHTGLRSATIRNIGDFVIHKEIFMQAERLASATGTDYDYNFAPMLNYIWDEIGNADFTVANVDGSLGGKQYYKYGYSGYPQINTPPYLLYALRDTGVDMLTLANNHMLDGWFDGMKATVNNVEKVNLKHVGASRTQEERDTPVIYEINGIKVGFLNYTESLNSMDTANGLTKDALIYGVHWTKNSKPNVDAAALREAGAEVIVCYMHWGEEYSEEPDSNQKSLAKTLVSAGVDVIIGGHPHVVQPATWLTGTNQFGEAQETLCLYSMGNFLSDQRQRYRDGGIMFDFTIQEQSDGSFKIINPEYLPTWVWKTGTSEDNYQYWVLPIDKMSSNRPKDMVDEDYQKMIQSYTDSVNAMKKGVGTVIAQ